jgi:GT2 family glycosyltransferase
MISLIVCSADDRKFAAVAEMYGRRLAGAAHEVVRVADARSLAEGYSRGIARSRGDVLLLSHDDVEVVAPDLPGRLAAHLAEFDLIGIAGTTRLAGPVWTAAGPPVCYGQVAYPAPPRGSPRAGADGFTACQFGLPARAVGGVRVLDGVFLAMRRAVAAQVSFDEATFDGFHLYDLDFTLRAALAGFRLGVACDVQLIHESVGNYGVAWSRYADRFARKHAAHIHPPAGPRQFDFGFVTVPTREALIEAMTPPHWS